MTVLLIGQVYYWNKQTNVTSWARPAGYVGPDVEAFLKNKDAADAGKKLDKIVEVLALLLALMWECGSVGALQSL